MAGAVYLRRAKLRARVMGYRCVTLTLMAFSLATASARAESWTAQAFLTVSESSSLTLVIGKMRS